MTGLIRLIVKFIFYVVIVIPVVRTVISALLWDNWVGWLIGVIVAVVVALWLETTGLSNKILARAFGGKDAGGESVGQAISGQLFGESQQQQPKGVETTMKCPNCGSQVTLINGHGKCRACDSAF